MGEVLPYTRAEISRLLDRATFKGVQQYDANCVVFVLEEYGTARRIELEVFAEADWPGSSDYAETKDIEATLTVYLRGVRDADH